MNYKTEISDFIDTQKDHMIDLLARFVKIPSVQDAPLENMPYGKGVDDMLKLAACEAKKCGLQVCCYQNKADIVNLNDKKTALAILCHLDVVPTTPDGWTSPPFEPRIEGNMMYGRGASDNKTPAVSALFALYALKALNVPLKHNVMLYLGGCEETGRDDLTCYVSENTMPEYVFTPDASFPVGIAERGRIVITCHGEFTSDTVLSVNAGIGCNVVPEFAQAVVKTTDIAKLEQAASQMPDVRFDIVSENDTVMVNAYGTSTHAARPSEGVNALTALLKVLGEIDGTMKTLSENFPHGMFGGQGIGLNGGLDISITQLKIQDGKLFFTVDGRVDFDRSSEAFAQIIKEHLHYPCEYVVDEPHIVDKNADIVGKLNKVYTEYTGREGGTYYMDAMTYAHNVEGAVIFGGVIPGDGAANVHGVNECTNLDTLVETSKIYAGAIMEICELENDDK